MIDWRVITNPFLTPFVSYIKPKHPDRTSSRAEGVHKIKLDDLLIHAPEQEQVIEWLIEWFEKLNLPLHRRLIPLAQNWAFESAFLKVWLGVDLCDQLFQAQARDTMIYATILNDKAACMGQQSIFKRVSLLALCEKLKITNPNPHDALSDCITTAQVYKAMLRTF